MRSSNRTPDEVDVYVGKRIRKRRNEMDLSQWELAEILGISFQQVQKYERGINRVAASTLFYISDVFGVEPNFFFRDLLDARGPKHVSVKETPEAALVHNFSKIADERFRKQVSDLAALLARVTNED